LTSSASAAAVDQVMMTSSWARPAIWAIRPNDALISVLQIDRAAHLPLGGPRIVEVAGARGGRVSVVGPVELELGVPDRHAHDSGGRLRVHRPRGVGPAPDPVPVGARENRPGWPVKESTPVFSGER